MQFRIEFQPEAERALAELEQADPKKHKKVLKTLGLMETDLRHPSLNTHAYDELIGPDKQKVFEAYVENKTPAAFRIFWYYGPGKSVVTILAITPHP
ncbi:hypothetical protein [Coleofasciculus sp. FACHB-129]|uniref:hypothetical protein n=1 Tax=Cyanophyceae TaxID=3028117 RepID=UPI0016836145|nr:hypothetical protein [Coleofasciculus sp. FACHB-129]MBD1895908.1 hypothetical protein [Coleofasciculus sp. FACHB-129]